MNQREILQWHRDERASLLRQIDGFSSGRIRSQADGYASDSGAQTVDRLRRRLAELDRFLGTRARPVPAAEGKD